jgi:hypothetical protein
MGGAAPPDRLLRGSPPSPKTSYAVIYHKMNLKSLQRVAAQFTSVQGGLPPRKVVAYQSLDDVDVSAESKR